MTRQRNIGISSGKNEGNHRMRMSQLAKKACSQGCVRGLKVSGESICKVWKTTAGETDN